MVTTGLRSVFVLALALLITACSASEAPTVAPTQTLIPSTPTPLPTPAPPTETPSSLLRPAEIGTEPTPSAAGFDASIDPALVRKAVDDLAAHLSIEPDTIEVVRVREARWIRTQLGCGGNELRRIGQPVAGFRLLLVAGSRAYDYHTDTGSQVRRCGNDVVRGDVLLELDPIAAELLALARRRLARELDLPTRRIRLVDMFPVHWSDSSLGCPLPDQSYAPANINGYRISLSAGDVQYIFHTDVERVIACDPELEQLPDGLSQSR